MVLTDYSVKMRVAVFVLTGVLMVVGPFLYLTNGEPPPAAKFFIDYVLSKQGQEILRKEGLIPANE